MMMIDETMTGSSAPLVKMSVVRFEPGGVALRFNRD